jgi:hypothetical protein
VRVEVEVGPGRFHSQSSASSPSHTT